MYQAILFDLDDTLFNLRGCEAEALHRTLESNGLRLPAQCADTYAAINSQYWAARAADGQAKLTRDEVVTLSWRDFLSHYGLDVAKSASLAERYWDAFCRSGALNPGAGEVLQRLSAAYRLGMITNGYSESQRGRLEAAGLLDAFDPLLISEEVGVAKPDRRIFEMALAQLRTPSEATLYVGDSLSHDREGCQRAGIDFCHFSPGWRVSDDLPAVKFRIGRLEELISILMPAAR